MWLAAAPPSLPPSLSLPLLLLLLLLLSADWSDSLAGALGLALRRAALVRPAAGGAGGATAGGTGGATAALARDCDAATAVPWLRVFPRVCRRGGALLAFAVGAVGAVLGCTGTCEGLVVSGVCWGGVVDCGGAGLRRTAYDEGVDSCTVQLAGDLPLRNLRAPDKVAAGSAADAA